MLPESIVIDMDSTGFMFGVWVKTGECSNGQDFIMEQPGFFKLECRFNSPNFEYYYSSLLGQSGSYQSDLVKLEKWKLFQIETANLTNISPRRNFSFILNGQSSHNLQRDPLTRRENYISFSGGSLSQLGNLCIIKRDQTPVSISSTHTHSMINASPTHTLTYYDMKVVYQNQLLDHGMYQMISPISQPLTQQWHNLADPQTDITVQMGSSNYKANIHMKLNSQILTLPEYYEADTERHNAYTFEFWFYIPRQVYNQNQTLFMTKFNNTSEEVLVQVEEISSTNRNIHFKSPSKTDRGERTMTDIDPSKWNHASTGMSNILNQNGKYPIIYTAYTFEKFQHQTLELTLNMVPDIATGSMELGMNTNNVLYLSDFRMWKVLRSPIDILRHMDGYISDPLLLRNYRLIQEAPTGQKGYLTDYAQRLGTQVILNNQYEWDILNDANLNKLNNFKDKITVFKGVPNTYETILKSEYFYEEYFKYDFIDSTTQCEHKISGCLRQLTIQVSSQNNNLLHDVDVLIQDEIIPKLEKAIWTKFQYYVKTIYSQNPFKDLLQTKISSHKFVFNDERQRDILSSNITMILIPNTQAQACLLISKADVRVYDTTKMDQSYFQDLFNSDARQAFYDLPYTHALVHYYPMSNCLINDQLVVYDVSTQSIVHTFTSNQYAQVQDTSLIEAYGEHNPPYKERYMYEDISRTHKMKNGIVITKQEMEQTGLIGCSLIMHMQIIEPVHTSVPATMDVVNIQIGQEAFVMTRDQINITGSTRSLSKPIYLLKWQLIRVHVYKTTNSIQAAVYISSFSRNQIQAKQARFSLKPNNKWTHMTKAKILQNHNTNIEFRIRYIGYIGRPLSTNPTQLSDDYMMYSEGLLLYTLQYYKYKYILLEDMSYHPNNYIIFTGEEDRNGFDHYSRYQHLQDKDVILGEKYYAFENITFESAIDFDRLKVGLQYFHTTQFAVTFWVYVVAPLSPIDILFNIGKGSTDAMVKFTCQNNNQAQCRYYIQDNVNVDITYQVQEYNQWYHLTYYRQMGKLQVYQNAKLVKSKAFTQSTTSVLSGTMQLGKTKMLMDDFRYMHDTRVNDVVIKQIMFGIKTGHIDLWLKLNVQQPDFQDSLLNYANMRFIQNTNPNQSPLQTMTNTVQKFLQNEKKYIDKIRVSPTLSTVYSTWTVQAFFRFKTLSQITQSILNIVDLSGNNIHQLQYNNIQIYLVLNGMSSTSKRLTTQWYYITAAYKEQGAKYACNLYIDKEEVISNIKNLTNPTFSSIQDCNRQLESTLRFTTSDNGALMNLVIWNYAMTLRQSYQYREYRVQPKLYQDSQQHVLFLYEAMYRSHLSYNDQEYAPLYYCEGKWEVGSYIVNSFTAHEQNVASSSQPIQGAGPIGLVYAPRSKFVGVKLPLGTSQSTSKSLCFWITGLHQVTLNSVVIFSSQKRGEGIQRQLLYSSPNELFHYGNTQLQVQHSQSFTNNDWSFIMLQPSRTAFIREKPYPQTNDLYFPFTEMSEIQIGERGADFIFSIGYLVWTSQHIYPDTYRYRTDLKYMNFNLLNYYALDEPGSTTTCLITKQVVDLVQVDDYVKLNDPAIKMMHHELGVRPLVLCYKGQKYNELLNICESDSGRVVYALKQTIIFQVIPLGNDQSNFYEWTYQLYFRFHMTQSNMDIIHFTSQVVTDHINIACSISDVAGNLQLLSALDQTGTRLTQSLYSTITDKQNGRWYMVSLRYGDQLSSFKHQFKAGLHQVGDQSWSSRYAQKTLKLTLPISKDITYHIPSPIFVQLRYIRMWSYALSDQQLKVVSVGDIPLPQEGLISYVAIHNNNLVDHITEDTKVGFFQQQTEVTTVFGTDTSHVYAQYHTQIRLLKAFQFNDKEVTINEPQLSKLATQSQKLADLNFIFIMRITKYPSQKSLIANFSDLFQLSSANGNTILQLLSTSDQISFLQRQDTTAFTLIVQYTIQQNTPTVSLTIIPKNQTPQSSSIVLKSSNQLLMNISTIQIGQNMPIIGISLYNGLLHIPEFVIKSINNLQHPQYSKYLLFYYRIDDYNEKDHTNTIQNLPNVIIDMVSGRDVDLEQSQSLYIVQISTASRGCSAGRVHNGIGKCTRQRMLTVDMAQQWVIGPFTHIKDQLGLEGTFCFSLNIEQQTTSQDLIILGDDLQGKFFMKLRSDVGGMLEYQVYVEGKANQTLEFTQSQKAFDNQWINECIQFRKVAYDHSLNAFIVNFYSAKFNENIKIHLPDAPFYIRKIFFVNSPGTNVLYLRSLSLFQIPLPTWIINKFVTQGVLEMSIVGPNFLLYLPFNENHGKQIYEHRTQQAFTLSAARYTWTKTRQSGIHEEFIQNQQQQSIVGRELYSLVVDATHNYITSNLAYNPKLFTMNTYIKQLKSPNPTTKYMLYRITNSLQMMITSKEVQLESYSTLLNSHVQSVDNIWMGITIGYSLDLKYMYIMVDIGNQFNVEYTQQIQTGYVSPQNVQFGDSTTNPVCDYVLGGFKLFNVYHTPSYAYSYLHRHIGLLLSYQDQQTNVLSLDFDLPFKLSTVVDLSNAKWIRDRNRPVLCQMGQYYNYATQTCVQRRLQLNLKDQLSFNTFHNAQTFTLQFWFQMSPVSNAWALNGSISDRAQFSISSKQIRCELVGANIPVVLAIDMDLSPNQFHFFVLRFYYITGIVDLRANVEGKWLSQKYENTYNQTLILGKLTSNSTVLLIPVSQSGQLIIKDLFFYTHYLSTAILEKRFNRKFPYEHFKSLLVVLPMYESSHHILLNQATPRTPTDAVLQIIKPATSLSEWVMPQNFTMDPCILPNLYLDQSICKRFTCQQCPVLEGMKTPFYQCDGGSQDSCFFKNISELQSRNVYNMFNETISDFEDCHSTCDGCTKVMSPQNCSSCAKGAQHSSYFDICIFNTTFISCQDFLLQAEIQQIQSQPQLIRFNLNFNQILTKTRTKISHDEMEVSLDGQYAPYRYNWTHQWNSDTVLEVKINHDKKFQLSDELLKVKLISIEKFQSNTSCMGQPILQKYISDAQQKISFDEQRAQVVGQVTSFVAIPAIFMSILTAGLVGASMELLWTFVNTMQIILYMPLLVDYYPRHVRLFLAYFSFMNFDIEILQNLYEDLVQVQYMQHSPHNIRFQLLGIESRKLLKNAGSILITMVSFFIIIPVVMLLVLVTRHFERLNRYLKKLLSQFKYNYLLRFLSETYLEFTFYSYLNLYAMSVGNKTESFSSVASIYTVLFMIATPFVLSLFTYKQRTRIHKRKFISQFGELYSDFKPAAPYFYPLFFFRRLGYVVLLINQTMRVSQQLAVFQFMSTILLGYIIAYSPLKSKLQQGVYIINELLLFFFNYLNMVLVYNDHTLKMQVGWVLIGLISAGMVFNLTISAFGQQALTIFNQRCLKKKIQQAPQMQRMQNAQLPTIEGIKHPKGSKHDINIIKQNPNKRKLENLIENAVQSNQNRSVISNTVYTDTGVNTTEVAIPSDQQAHDGFKTLSQHKIRPIIDQPIPFMKPSEFEGQTENILKMKPINHPQN